MKDKSGLLGIVSVIGLAIGSAIIGNEVYSIKKKKDFIWNHPDEYEKTVLRKSK